LHSALFNSVQNHYIAIMTPIRILAPSLIAFTVVSCASEKADQYDTVSPSGTAAASPVSAPVTPPSNPVYDTPPAYEESGATAATMPPVPAGAARTTTPNIPAHVVPKAPSNGAAIIHTVVTGDTLSGISSKYKVSAAAIKQANGMTKDTVVLGKKMVIPPAR
jgi:LysM repeat protein